MNQRNSFYRKVVYGLAIIILAFFTFWLSEPASRTSAGGTLSQMRREHRLSQDTLGKIDPASSVMKLSTLGMKSVAVWYLWDKTDEFKKKEDWSALTTTLDTLTTLNPNIISTWKYQSWNVSYNVSVQFDDYRDRYHYVRRGIEYLEDGIEYNNENRDIPQLLWDLGWFIGQKVGRADEYVQYRRLFKEDDEYHQDDPPRGSDLRDNWLVSKAEYLNCIAAIRERGKSLGKKSEKIVYSSPAKSQMNYAEAIGEEGFFEKGRAAWVVALDDWLEFGDRVIQHSTGRYLRLGHEDKAAAIVADLEAQLDAFDPGLRDKIRKEQIAKLPEEQQNALEVPESERTPQQMQLGYEAEMAATVTDEDVLARLVDKFPGKEKEIGAVYTKLVDKRIDLTYTKRYKTDSNYDYWQVRAEFEQTDNAVEARRKMFDGKQAHRQGDESAVELYEEGFKLWEKVFEEFPVLLDPDGTTGDDIFVFILEYRKVLDSLDREIPDDFPLWNIIENFDAEQELVDDLEAHKQRMGRQSPTPPGEQDEPAAEAESESKKKADEPAEASESNDDETTKEETPGPSEPEEAKPAEGDKKPATSDQPAEPEETPAEEPEVSSEPTEEAPSPEPTPEESPTPSGDEL